jgi:hypothetical protein
VFVLEAAELTAIDGVVVAVVFAAIVVVAIVELVVTGEAVFEVVV